MPIFSRTVPPQAIQRTSTQTPIKDAGPAQPLRWNVRTVPIAGRQRIEAVLPGKMTPVGQVEVVFGQGRAELMNLRVAPEYRRHSIGSGLVQQAVQAARTRGIASISLVARPDPGALPAPALVKMYQKAGFRNTGMTSLGPQMTLGGAPQPRSAQPPVYRPSSFSGAGGAAQRSLVRPGFPPPPRPVAPGPQAFYAAAAIQKMDDRYNTMYTYMLTRPTSLLTGTPQGPHTVAHSLVSYGMGQVVSPNDWDSLEGLFDSQVPHPDDIETILASELPPKALSNNTVKAKIERYKDDYMILHANIEYALENTADADFNETFAAIRQIMEMHPYQTYAWKTGKAASKRSTKGKSESKHLKDFKSGNMSSLKGLIDKSRAKFNEPAQFLYFLKQRLSLVVSESDLDKVLQSI